MGRGLSLAGESHELQGSRNGCRLALVPDYRRRVDEEAARRFIVGFPSGRKDRGIVLIADRGRLERAGLVLLQEEKGPSLARPELCADSGWSRRVAVTRSRPGAEAGHEGSPDACHFDERFNDGLRDLKVGDAVLVLPGWIARSETFCLCTPGTTLPIH